MWLTDTAVKNLPAPAKGNSIVYDGGKKEAVKGFGCRVTASGARGFILNYRTRTGRERRYTIGSYPEWSSTSAREKAKELKRRIRDEGYDPLAALEADREAPTVADLCKQALEDHYSRRRESTRRDAEAMMDKIIKPDLQHHKVAEVTFSDIDALHRKISKRAPYRANRVLALLSKMFALAVKWGWRTDNPCKGVERNQEVRRNRYLSPEEMVKLSEALASYPDQRAAKAMQGRDDLERSRATQAANIIRLLLLTGARSGEVRSAKWADLDLDKGTWIKPGATTKQKTEHRVPLSDAARKLLLDIKADAEPDAEYVFPGRGTDYRQDIKHDWAAITKAAGLEGVRIHDLRHSYASVLASAGMSLPIIGALLGHTQPQTTHRYAHLMDDPLRQATERAAAVIGGKPSAEVVRHPRAAE